MAEVAREQEELNRMWNEKEKTLKDMLELQLFNREADYIDSATKGHDAFLELADLGVRSPKALLLSKRRVEERSVDIGHRGRYAERAQSTLLFSKLLQ